VINLTSQRQESDVIKALALVVDHLAEKFGKKITLVPERQWHLNQEGGKFNRGSFYFRPHRWLPDEMFTIMNDIAERSVLYYFSKYREEHFQLP